MKACVLIAAPADRMNPITDALAAFETLRTADEQRARLLLSVGSFQAVVLAGGFLADVTATDAGESPIVRLETLGDLTELAANVGAAIQRRRARDHHEAPGLEPLSTLPYETYMELVRFGATRRYLLGLMRRHRGSVTEASLAAGIARESLHRQLRRHDVDADAFRDPDAR